MGDLSKNINWSGGMNACASSCLPVIVMQVLCLCLCVYLWVCEGCYDYWMRVFVNWLLFWPNTIVKPSSPTCR